MNQKVERLQNNLALIRCSAGISGAELGKRLGVSRQMISNLEHNESSMTLMQYHAIRHILCEEIENAKCKTAEPNVSSDSESVPEDGTVLLQSLLQTLIDEPELFSSSEREKVISDAKILVPAIVSKSATREKVSMLWMLAPFAGATIVAMKALSKKKEK